jgi:hypothetical protein
MKRYLVTQIGCIECGVSSYPVSLHDDIEEAKQAAKDHPSTWETEGGDGYTTVYDLISMEDVG